MKIIDKRPRCPHCGATTWQTDYEAFMRDHDRPQGGVCRKAQNEALADARKVVGK
jgi:ribosomal protein S27AE